MSAPDDVLSTARSTSTPAAASPPSSPPPTGFAANDWYTQRPSPPVRGNPTTPSPSQSESFKARRMSSAPISALLNPTPQDAPQVPHTPAGAAVTSRPFNTEARISRDNPPPSSSAHSSVLEDSAGTVPPRADTPTPPVASPLQRESFTAAPASSAATSAPTAQDILQVPLTPVSAAANSDTSTTEAQNRGHITTPLFSAGAATPEDWRSLASRLAEMASSQTKAAGNAITNKGKQSAGAEPKAPTTELDGTSATGPSNEPVPKEKKTLVPEKKTPAPKKSPVQKEMKKSASKKGKAPSPKASTSGKDKGEGPKKATAPRKNSKNDQPKATSSSSAARMPSEYIRIVMQ